jgi:23S rRNA (guanine745-N1)-methyltransferase
MKDFLKCPICNGLLQKEQNSYVCSNRHSFDISKYGYVNLLPCNQKNSKDPGDSKEMMKARDSFLRKGYYSKISDSLNKIVLEKSEAILNNKNVNIIYTGCGTGYYFVNLRNFLLQNTKGKIINYLGLDISKHAINIASKANKNIKWIVGNSYNIPILDRTQDIIINIFASYKLEELNRILKPDGKIYFVIPNKDHLNNFREILYGDENNSNESNSLLTKIEKSNIFKIISSFEVKYKINLTDNKDVMDLLTMTPYYWNIDLKTLDKVKKTNNIELLVSVSVYEVGKQSITL